MADLGPGNDSLAVEGSLAGARQRPPRRRHGNDMIHGGPEDDLIEAGPGADKLYGGDGADGLIGGLPGPTYLYGEGDGDLLAAGGGCAGGALVGGPGRDDASFAETQAHPGMLLHLLPRARGLDRRDQGLRQRPPPPTDEDMEGSFDWDVLIGDGRANAMLGQPGEDVFYRQRRRRRDRRPRRRPRLLDPVRPRQATAQKKQRQRHDQAHRHAAGRALTDSFDPTPFNCADDQTRHPRPRPQRLTGSTRRITAGESPEPPFVLCIPVGYKRHEEGTAPSLAGAGDAAARGGLDPAAEDTGLSRTRRRRPTG